MFVREDIPCKQPFAQKCNLEAIFFDLNLKNTKWLCCGGYNNHNNNISGYVKAIENCLDIFIKNYENLLILDDFNAESDDPHMKTFCETFKLKHLVKVPTCFKNPINLKCIDKILTNRVHHFQNTTAVETGLSDHHKLIVTVLKNEIPKIAPKIIKFRNLKNLDDARFKNELVDRLSEYDIGYKDGNTNDVKNANISYEIFHNIFMGLNNKYAPLNTKYLRGNHALFMSKLLTQNFSQRIKL